MTEDRTGRYGIARRDVLKAATIAPLATVGTASFAGAHAVPNPPNLWGVNLAGADFGKLLGRHGTEYLYPLPANLDYYASLGFSLVRIPFKWERLQPKLNAPFDGEEFSRLNDVVTHARRLGLAVVLDPHNYARRRLAGDNWTKEYMIGSAKVPLEAFLDFWRRLSDDFGHDDKVMFGLMNEPHGMSAGDWLEIANATIAAIRSQRARNMIFVPGTAYTGAHSWFDAGNTIMERVKDPADTFAFEVHQYLDGDSSGTSAEAVSSTIGSERLEAFQNWARQHGFRAFLGEYNAGRGERSLRALMDLCDELNANSDVWLGSAAWAGGPRWPEDEMFNLEPYEGGHIREQTEIIRSRARRSASQRHWVGASPVFYVDLARVVSSDSPGHEASKAAIRTGAGQLLSADLPVDPDLATLLQRSDFAVVIELRDVRPKRQNYPLLNLPGSRLLYFTAHGELATDLGGGYRTAAQSADFWNAKRRCGLSFRSATGELTIGITGAPPVTAKISNHPLADRDRSDPAPPIRLGDRSVAPSDGRICRIVGFPVFLGRDALAANLA